MTKISRSALAITFVALAGTTLGGCGSNPAQPPKYVPTEQRAPFLSPLKHSLFLHPDDPRVTATCQEPDERGECAPVLRFGGTGEPGPVIPPVFGTDVRHLWLGFRLTSIRNVPIAGGGVPIIVEGERATNTLFGFSSPVIEGGPTINYSTGVNAVPGETRTRNDLIWRGVLEDGCISPPPVIPIDFTGVLRLGIDEEGNYNPFSGELVDVDVFETTDDSSLVPTGFWNFQYTLRASVSGGDIVSDFEFSGKVSVLCTNDLSPLQSGSS